VDRLPDPAHAVTDVNYVTELTTTNVFQPK